MQQLPHFLRGPRYGHEIPLVTTELILAARASPAHPDGGLGSVELGVLWWDARSERWASFTATAHGGPLPTPWTILAPAGQVERGPAGPDAPYRYQPPYPHHGPVIPDNADDYVSNGDEVQSYGSAPTDMESDTLGQTPPDGNYSESDSD